ncbi:uncharacterized protein TNCV_4779671 [Trichonephila clavipes]|nr:uncharacterized protein TNCV_4779671 [Trichonephila clavipes]
MINKGDKAVCVLCSGTVCVKDVPLSRNTMKDRILKLAENVTDQQKNDINSAPFKSLCLDESIDITKSAHLAVFARYCVGNIIKEELIAITLLLTTTKGTDICTAENLHAISSPDPDICITDLGNSSQQKPRPHPNPTEQSTAPHLKRPHLHQTDPSPQRPKNPSPYIQNKKISHRILRPSQRPLQQPHQYPSCHGRPENSQHAHPNNPPKKILNSISDSQLTPDFPPPCFQSNRSPSMKRFLKTKRN